jgi:hypothetical protein
MNHHPLESSFFEQILLYRFTAYGESYSVRLAVFGVFRGYQNPQKGLFGFTKTTLCARITVPQIPAKANL